MLFTLYSLLSLCIPRQLATELSRLTEELRKEKEGWETSDWKMNDMIEKWWGQMMENEEERGKIRSRMEHLEREKRMEAVDQIKQARASFSKQQPQQQGGRGPQQSDARQNKAVSAKVKVERHRFTDSLYEDSTVENEWASRKEEMAETRRKVALSNQTRAEKLVEKVKELSLQSPPVPAAAAQEASVQQQQQHSTALEQYLSSTTVDPLTSDAQMQLVDLTAIAQPSSSSYAPLMNPGLLDQQPSPTKSVSFRFDNSSGQL